MLKKNVKASRKNQGLYFAVASLAAAAAEKRSYQMKTTVSE